MLLGYKESAAERVLIVEFVARVQLDAIREMSRSTREASR